MLVARAFVEGKKLRGHALHNFNLVLAKKLLAKDMPKEKIRLILNFLSAYVHFENQGMIDKFRNELEVITQQSRHTMGVMEYLQKVAEEEAEEKAAKTQYQIIRNLLLQGVSKETIAICIGVSVAFVEGIMGEIQNPTPSQS